MALTCSPHRVPIRVGRHKPPEPLTFLTSKLISLDNKSPVHKAISTVRGCNAPETGIHPLFRYNFQPKSSKAVPSKNAVRPIVKVDLSLLFLNPPSALCKPLVSVNKPLSSSVPTNNEPG